MAAEKAKLTVKQKRFVEEYVIDHIAVQAYFRAFGRLKSNGQSRSYGVAAEQARRLLQKPEIQAEIRAAQDEYVRRTRVSKLRVLREVAALATSDHGDLFDEDPVTGLPTPRRWSQVSPAARRAVQSIKVKRRIVKKANEPHDLQEEVEEIEYKLHSKTDALDKLCKKLGFYSDAPQAGDTPAVIVVEENGRDQDD